MRYLTVALIITFSVYSSQVENSVQNVRTACLEASEADEAKIEKIREGASIEDEQISSYFYCAFLQLNFITFSVEEVPSKEIINTLPISDKGKLKPIVETCINNSKDMADKIPYALYKCFVRELGPIKDFI